MNTNEELEKARDRIVEAIAGGTISVPGGYGNLARDDAENIADAAISAIGLADRLAALTTPQEGKLCGVAHPFRDAVCALPEGHEPGHMCETPTPQERKAHDHSDEPMLWCETHQREHIAGIPRFTYQCKDCGWGQWYRDQAREHESATTVSFHHRHETYEVEHVLRLIAPPAPQEGDARIEMSKSSVVAYHEWRKALGSERLSDDEGTAARIAFYAGWDHALARAAVPDAAPDGQVIIPIARIHELRAAKDAALAAIERVRAVHLKFTYYELEDSCPDTSEDHREERHHESDEIGEFYCEDMPTGDVVCDMCRDADGERMEWPCPTVAALDGAPEPEWEYRVVTPLGTTWLVSNVLGQALASAVANPGDKVERRRKAGQWEPVGGESE